MKKRINSDKNELGVMAQDGVLIEMKANSVLKYRTIPLYEEVDRDSMYKCLYWLEKLVRSDKERGIKEPITIMIDSYGGYCTHGLSLISRIEQLREDGYEIIGIVTGNACSMGSAILNVCSTRKAYRYSRILIHQVSGGTYGTQQEMEENIEETNRLWEILKGLYVKYTNITNEQLEDIKIRKYDWILDPQHALELKVVDEIL